LFRLRAVVVIEPGGSNVTKVACASAAAQAKNAAIAVHSKTHLFVVAVMELPLTTLERLPDKPGCT
jgi:hypothetical protein